MMRGNCKLRVVVAGLDIGLVGRPFQKLSPMIIQNIGVKQFKLTKPFFQKTLKTLFQPEPELFCLVISTSNCSIETIKLYSYFG